MTELLEPQYDGVTFDKGTVSPPPEYAHHPLSFSWEDSRQDEIELGLEVDCPSPTQDDKYYVCPSAVKRLKHGGVHVMDEENPARMLCQRSLSLVYSTIQESYPEGTLQLLSDLLQPGYYPPNDITCHLLEEILLNPQSPHHNCVQAFRLLMRTQRHCIVDKKSVSWNWEMLSKVMEKMECRPESVRMFLDYVAQTLEDDFKTKQSTSTLYQSIAKDVFSFDQQFPHIRDICKWLFSAIEKSTDGNDIKGDHGRMVASLQKILSLALEVDGSPAISSVKLSQELFHLLISRVPQRRQVKTSVPISLSLLLHFLKNCTLSLDSNDGTEKWRRWEELIHHLWMFLLSYINTIKGYRNGVKMEQMNKDGSWIYKPEDKVSKCAVREAVEAFLSRSRDDIGEALPLHVEESLTYLQDHLLDVCQC
ncbi:hypothetical protein WMY93_009723 [Mugilogobius chulae]|uniref:Uncharacterized protein n=1 Tax=Mugilogobius chulae TaxID=88201 RepID=A0AAW0PDM6_9GOBI